MYNTLVCRLGFLLGVLFVLAGCIKPEVAEITATPNPTVTTGLATMPPAPTPAATTPASAPGAAPGGSTFLPLVQQFIQSRGITPTSLDIWYEQALAPDQLLGFSYSDSIGQPCSGYMLAAFTNGVWVPNVGGVICGMSPEVPAQAGMIPILTSSGQPYTLVFGRVQEPSVTSVAVVYDDGTNQPAAPTREGFMVVKPGIVGVVNITAISQEGNTVIASIPQLPVQ